MHHRQETMIDNITSIAPSEEDAGEVALVTVGYTVSSRGRCITRIGAEYVMRDASEHCVRSPVATTDVAALGVMWANFGPPADATERAHVARDVTRNGPVHAKEVALELQGYTVSTRGICLARVVGNYVTRDGLRRCIRFLVDTVDPTTLSAAWTVFSGAVGWVGEASMGRAEITNGPANQWAGAVENRPARTSFNRLAGM